MIAGSTYDLSKLAPRSVDRPIQIKRHRAGAFRNRRRTVKSGRPPIPPGGPRRGEKAGDEPQQVDPPRQAGYRVGPPRRRRARQCHVTTQVSNKGKMTPRDGAKRRDGVAGAETVWRPLAASRHCEVPLSNR